MEGIKVGQTVADIRDAEVVTTSTCGANPGSRMARADRSMAFASGLRTNQDEK